MKPLHTEDINLENETDTSSSENKDCGCSTGICPGTILAGLMLGGWGLWTLGTWIWNLIAN